MNECTKEGTFPAVITRVSTIQHRFNNESDDIELKFEFHTEDGAVGAAYLDMSCDYYQGTGNNSGKMQKDVSAQTLSHFGVNMADPNCGNQLGSMVGKQVEIRGKKTKSGFLAFYLNTMRPEVQLDARTAQARIAALFGSGAQQPAQGFAAAPQHETQQAPQQNQGNLFPQPPPQQSRSPF